MLGLGVVWEELCGNEGDGGMGVEGVDVEVGRRGFIGVVMLGEFEVRVGGDADGVLLVVEWKGFGYVVEVVRRVECVLFESESFVLDVKGVVVIRDGLVVGLMGVVVYVGKK